MRYKEIRAVYTESTVRVYQAFPRVIAEEAVLNGTFGKNFKMSRMTWIKPSFLWMMYRCGWGEKENQECVLAIDLKRDAFDFIIKNAVLSTYHSDMGITEDEWKEQVKKSEVRCQWDPERDIHGNPLGYRSIQLGLRGQMVYHYVHDWIVKITDISGYVTDLRNKKRKGIAITALLPDEQIYPLNLEECK